MFLQSHVVYDVNNVRVCNQNCTKHTNEIIYNINIYVPALHLYESSLS